jgi:uncharacterized membrane protein YvbJ
MVVCTRCGIKNVDNARFCVNCGTELYSAKLKKRDETCFGRPEKRIEEECFDLPHGGVIIGIIFGILMIFIGLAMAFGFNVGRFIGPSFMIIVGLFIILGAIYGLRRP